MAFVSYEKGSIQPLLGGILPSIKKYEWFHLYMKKHYMAFLRYCLLSIISLTAFSATEHGFESVGRIQKVIFLGMHLTHERHCNVPKSKPKDILEIKK